MAAAPGVLSLPSGRLVRGRGRTGTAPACIAVLGGVPADHAASFVRGQYNPHAVETPWQRRHVEHFAID